MTVNFIKKWASHIQSQSLWYYPVGSGFGLEEVLGSGGCRYDIERFGCKRVEDPKHADLLIVSGAVTYKSGSEILSIYDEMLEPKYVMAIGVETSSGGAFSPELSYSVIPGLDRIIPVDVYVPGIPPRPEAIMDGIIKLQEVIYDQNRTH